MKNLIFLIALLWAPLSLAAGKDLVPPNLIITSCAMTGTATCTSAVADIRGFDNIAFQAIWTGTPNGTFAIQVSEDYNANTGNTGTWKALSTTFTGPSGSSGNSYAEVNQSAAAYMRVVYTNSSSTGVLNLYYGAKAL